MTIGLAVLNGLIYVVWPDATFLWDRGYADSPKPYLPNLARIEGLEA